MYLEECGFLVPELHSFHRKRLLTPLQPAPQPPEYPPAQKGASFSSSGCTKATFSKGIGAHIWPAFSAIALVASRKHTLPPEPLLAVGPMTHTQAGLAGGKRSQKGDSTERQRAVTRT